MERTFDEDDIREAYKKGYIDGQLALKEMGYMKVTADRKGEWIPVDYKTEYMCSACGYHIDTNYPERYSFCPGCGSDNRKEKDEEH